MSFYNRIQVIRDKFYTLVGVLIDINYISTTSVSATAMIEANIEQLTYQYIMCCRITQTTMPIHLVNSLLIRYVQAMPIDYCTSMFPVQTFHCIFTADSYDFGRSYRSH